VKGKIKIKHDVIVNCYSQEEVVGRYSRTYDYQPSVEEIQETYEVAVTRLPQGRKKIEVLTYYTTPEN
jgi:hypothetical protein